MSGPPSMTPCIVVVTYLQKLANQFGTATSVNTFPLRTNLEFSMRYLLSLAALSLLAPAFAADAPTIAAKPYPLKICIISGDELGDHGEPMSKVYEGQEVKFCCKPCIKKFDKDVAGNLKKIAEKTAGKAAK